VHGAIHSLTTDSKPRPSKFQPTITNIKNTQECRYENNETVSGYNVSTNKNETPNWPIKTGVSLIFNRFDTVHSKTVQNSVVLKDISCPQSIFQIRRIPVC